MFGIFSKLRSGLESTKNKLKSTIKSIFFGRTFDPNALETIEAALYSADVGTTVTEAILAEMKEAYKTDKTLRKEDVDAICKRVLLKNLEGAERDPSTILDEQAPTVIALIGTNGSGKTTTAAKLAHYFTQRGKSVIVGACDTFRAAANEQLRVWSDRLKFSLVESHTGADSAAVAYDTCQAAMSRKKDVVILDTAGRLHNKANLLTELQKLKRAIGKIDERFPQQLWLVVDASLGSNTVVSAETFHKELGLTGVIVTKLDGSSRGGALVGIHRNLGIPVYFIGLGEQAEDLEPFKVKEYVEALIGE